MGNVASRLRIAFSSIVDPRDVTAASGVPCHTTRSLERLGHDVRPVGPLIDPRAFAFRARRAAARRLGLPVPSMEMDRWAVRTAVRSLTRQLGALGADVVLSAGAVPLGDTKVPAPHVIYSDASFASVVEKYRAYRGLSPWDVRRHNAAEGRALRGAAFTVFASGWAATEAIQYYDIDPARVRVVPRGAGMPGLGSTDEARDAIRGRDLRSPRLTIIGVDWERKGGELALQVVRRLRSDGLDASLTLVGGRLPAEVRALPYVETTGFLRKDDAQDLLRLEGILRDSTYVLLLSRAEAFGISVAEGNAYAVPCAVSEVDGLASLVRPGGGNGRRFPLWATADDIADAIGADVSDPRRYESLAMAAYREYRERLNWDAAGRALAEILEDAVRCSRL